MMKVIVIILMVGILQAKAGTALAQKVTIKERNVSLSSVLKQIGIQSGYDVVYNRDIVSGYRIATISLSEVSVEQALTSVIGKLPLVFTIEDKMIMIRRKLQTVTPVPDVQVTGTVTDSLSKKPIAGVNVRLKGKEVSATTTAGGTYSIRAEMGDILIFSYVGFSTKEIKVTSTTLNVRLSETINNMDNIVVTGMMNREKSSFTGASASFTGDQLKQVGSQNIVQSLRTLDPSFIQVENNLLGSNPNVLPSIELRGQTSISTSTLRDQFSNDPNQPLFILDGFETTLRTIIDLDMNTVASATILKDAASTAIYGSRASNGVVVIETKKPLPGKLRLSYTSDLNIELPDLSSYNMMNAAEKLKFEKLAGRYTSEQNNLSTQLILDTVYNARLKEVLRGVDTYWLSQPLQTGFSQRHSINASGGDNMLRYDIGANIRKNDATMIGSKRDDWGANINLTYRSGIFNIGNRVYVSGAEAAESPYGNFSTWVNTNPYYRLLGADKKYLDEAISPSFYVTGLSNGNELIPNPLYNASLNSFDKTSSFNLQNNFQLNADFNRSLRLQLNAQVIKSTTEQSTFVSPLNTSFDNQQDPALKGSYNYQKLSGLSYTVNTSLTFAQVLGGKHSINSQLRAELSQNKNNINGYSAVGFPSSSNGNPAFAYGFKDGATPTTANALTRRNSLVFSANYSYDSRFNVDVNLNIDGSTAFGSNHRYAPYYSAGLSWNIHNERFMKKATWINNLRLRANIGETGNQNFGSVSESVFNYYNFINGFGQGVYLSALGAPDLQWQRTLQTSLGLDAGFLNNRLSLQVNVYQKVTDPLVVAITLPSSTGLTNYPFNAGASTVRGIESTLFFSPIYNPGNVVWTLGLTGTMISQKYGKFDDKLSGLNNELRNSNSLTRYRDGYSSYDLWAVPSLGIDPATGREVFLKKNGQQTFTYDVADAVVVGNSSPAAEGVLSSTLFYKGFTAGIAIRYVIDRNQFNNALYQKVENISYEALRNNQDKRALYDRWQNPGDITEFKAISARAVTPMSSRFIQSETSFSAESINLGYEFRDKKWLAKAALSALNITARSNNLFYISTVRRERGTEYPFAHSVSMSLRATFK